MALQKEESTLLVIWRWVFIALLIFVVGFPFYWMIISSIKPEAEIFSIPPTFWPRNFYFKTYIQIWKTIPLLNYLLNSVIVTVLTIIVSLTLTSTAAYSLSRFKFRGKSLVIMVLLFTQLLPLSLLIIPYYFLLNSVGLLDTRLGLILSYSTFAIPISVLILRSYFKSAYPPSLEEAAMIDGCTRFGAFIRIAIPLSKPGLIAVGTMVGIRSWKEFMFASILINSGSKKVISLGLTDLIGQGGIEYVNQFMTTAIYACLPVLLVFLYFQKQMVTGMTSGSIK